MGCNNAGGLLKTYGDFLSCVDLPSVMADLISSLRSVYLLDLCMHRLFRFYLGSPSLLTHILGRVKLTLPACS